MSFAHAPVTKGLMLALGVSSLLVSIFDVKHYTQLQLRPHISRDHQYWRLFTHHLAFANSSELFVAELLLYQVSIPIERSFGSAKFASFAVVSSLLSTIFAFVALLIFNSLGLNYIPAGPTALLISIVFQYYRTTPSVYTFRISKLDFSNKIFQYILALQLFLAHPPGTFLTALIGILTGALYRADFLGLNAFRLSHPIQSFSKRTLTPLLGSLDPPVRSNRALPDAFVPPNTVEDEAITTARPAAPGANSEPPRSAEDSANTTTTTSGPADDNEGPDSQMQMRMQVDADRRQNAHIRRQSIMNQWVDELIGRGSAAGVRVPTADEISQLSSMFPDAPRERILQTLQRSPDAARAVEMMLLGES